MRALALAGWVERCWIGTASRGHTVIASGDSWYNICMIALAGR